MMFFCRQDYLSAMAAASNFAWVNRATMTFLCRQAFAKQFNCSADDLDMNVVYDVSHNIAKIEQHSVNGKPMELLVHRKGATRAFPPHHPLIPVDYQFTGQPVLIGGSLCWLLVCFFFFFSRSRNHGHSVIRAHGYGSGHERDIWFHLPWRRKSHFTQQKPQRAGPHRCVADVGRQRHIYSCGLAQACHGRGS